MSKTLEKLITKAEMQGKAHINGRLKEYDFGHTYVGDLEEKYAMEIENGIFTMRHWGTETLKIDLRSRKIKYWYGESKSDADSMNFVLNRYEIGGKFSYRPSIDKFTYNE